MSCISVSGDRCYSRIYTVEIEADSTYITCIHTLGLQLGSSVNILLLGILVIGLVG